MATLMDYWKRLEKDGPSHVLMDKDGTVMMTKLAQQKDPDLSWDLVYIRNDGYTLACDFYLGQYAEALHRAEWVAMIRRGDLKPRLVHY